MSIMVSEKELANFWNEVLDTLIKYWNAFTADCVSKRDISKVVTECRNANKISSIDMSYDDMMTIAKAKEHYLSSRRVLCLIDFILKNIQERIQIKDDSVVTFLQSKLQVLRELQFEKVFDWLNEEQEDARAILQQGESTNYSIYYEHFYKVNKFSHSLGIMTSPVTKFNSSLIILRLRDASANTKTEHLLFVPACFCSDLTNLLRPVYLFSGKIWLSHKIIARMPRNCKFGLGNKFLIGNSGIIVDSIPAPSRKRDLAKLVSEQTATNLKQIDWTKLGGVLKPV